MFISCADSAFKKRAICTMVVMTRTLNKYANKHLHFFDVIKFGHDWWFKHFNILLLWNSLYVTEFFLYSY